MAHLPSALRLCAALVCLGAGAAACPSGERLFHCTLSEGRQQLDLCRTGDAVLLLFGAPDKPAGIAVAGASAALALERLEPDSLRLAMASDGFRYRLTVDHPGGSVDEISARFEIFRGDSAVAAMACDRGSIDLRPDMMQTLPPLRAPDRSPAERDD